MVLADLTMTTVGGTTVTSQNDSPTTNPTLRVQWGGTTGTIFGTPTGDTINGQNIKGIDNGQVTFFFKQNWQTNNGSRVSTGALIRYIDANNFYRVRYRNDFGGANDAVVIEIMNGGVLTTIATLTTALFDVVNTWYKARVTWWSALGKIWFRAEVATSPYTSFTQIGADTSYTTDTHKGSTNKVGFCLSMDTFGGFGDINFTSIEDLAIYRG